MKVPVFREIKIMQSEKETENATAKRKKKPLKWLLAAVVVLILLAFFFIPAYVSSEGGRFGRSSGGC